MATKKKSKRRKKGGRKLEFAIYITGVLAACLIALGVVKAAQAIFGDAESMENHASSSSVSDNTSDSAQPTGNNTTSGVSTHEGSSPEESTQESSSQTNSQPTSSESSAPSGDSSTPATDSTPKGDYINYTKTGVAELSEWYLLLVNPTNTIGSDWKADMTYLDSEYQLDSRIIDAYNDMVAAARKDGVSIYAISCYRSYSRQQTLYSNRVDRAKRENPSFTQQEAEDYAAARVARPGTSEHQTGLAIDFNSVETSFGSTSAGKWLKANAENYGFILRYEEDKQDKTGVTWEPWHYRFVGVKHAKRMNQLGYCLEEYVDYIKNGGQ